MITLGYAKKIGDRYVMNFFADTEEDLENFDTKANFMFYGAPLAGSVITCTSGEQKTSYYIDKSGSLVKIKSGDVPSGIGEYELNKIINAVIFDPTAKTPDEIDAFLDTIDFSEDDKIVLAHTSREGSQGSLPGSIYAKESEGVIGIQVFLDTNGLIYLKQGMSMDPVEGGKWYEFDGEGAFVEITEKTTFDLPQDVTIDEVSELFAPLNGTVFGCIEAEASGYTEFRENQVISGLKFDVENGEEFINNLVNYLSTYVGVNEDGYVEIEETTVGSVSSDAGWNGVILGKNDAMDAIAVNDVLTQIKVADTMSKEDVVSILEGLTYNSYNETTSSAVLVENDDRSTFVEVRKQQNRDNTGYNYFICVDTDGPTDYERNHVVIFASSQDYYEEDYTSSWIDLGKDGWIDSYVIADSISTYLMDCGYCYLFLSSVPYNDEEIATVLAAYEGVDGAGEDEAYTFIWSSAAFDMEGWHIQKGWQNLKNGVFNFKYNHIVKDVSKMPGWNALLVGANEVYNTTTYNISGNITNGSIVQKESDTEIITGGYAEVEIAPNEGYLAPESVSVHAAAYTLDVDGNAVVYLKNPQNDVEITATCPPAQSLVQFSVGQTITGFDFGNVQNGDTNDAIEAFLEGLTYDDGIAFIVTGSPDGLLMAFKMPIDDSFGYLLAYGEGTPLYSTVSVEEVTRGYRNLTDGKFDFSTLIGAQTVSDVSDAQGWNGVFVGAVEGEPGPTPSLTPFSVGQTITGVDFGNVQNGDTSDALDAFLAGLTYDQGQFVFVNFGEQGIAAADFGDGTYIIAYSGREGNAILYATKSGSYEPAGWTWNAGYQNLSDGKYNFGVNFEAVSVSSEQGWNGVLIGAVEGAPTPSTLTPFSVGQSITGFDLGNVSNGDTNADLDAWLAAQNYDEEGLVMLASGSAGADVALAAVYVEGVHFIGFNETILYLDADDSEFGSRGYRNLTDGKCSIGGTTTLDMVSDIAGWNGVFVGAVTE